MFMFWCGINWKQNKFYSVCVLCRQRPSLRTLHTQTSHSISDCYSIHSPSLPHTVRSLQTNVMRTENRRKDGAELPSCFNSNALNRHSQWMTRIQFIGFDAALPDAHLHAKQRRILSSHYYGQYCRQRNVGAFQNKWIYLKHIFVRFRYTHSTHTEREREAIYVYLH